MLVRTVMDSERVGVVLDRCRPFRLAVPGGRPGMLLRESISRRGLIRLAESSLETAPAAEGAP